MVTQHSKVYWACVTAFIKLTPSSVFAPLWCDSQQEREKEVKARKKREGKGGRQVQKEVY